MKIAIILPEKSSYREVWRSARLAVVLQSLKGADGSDIEVVIGLPRANDEMWRRGEAEIRAIAPRCIVRHLGWERVETEMALRMYSSVKADLAGIAEVSIPRDWGWNFTDCDAWIVFADASQGAILPIKPTAFYLRDLAVRYVPDAYADSIRSSYWERQTEAFRLWRQSRAVVATSAATLDDASSYAGIQRDRLVKVPALLADPVERAKRDRAASPDLLWLVEPDAGHDLANALEGLRLYRAEAGSARIFVAGAEAHHMATPDRLPALGGIPAWSQTVLKDVAFEPITYASNVRRLLRRVDLVWSSAIADGENEGLLFAGAARLPFVGYRYPQNEALSASLAVRASFYTDNTPADIADALHAACDTLNFPEDHPAMIPLAEEWLAVVDRLVS